MNAVIGTDGVARCAWVANDPLLRDYHDTEWGRPVHGERELFERLCLEAFQAGLSWRTVLAKRDAFRIAFDDFRPDVVASYPDSHLTELLQHPGIIRNRRKIEAVRRNARAVVALRGGAAGGLEGLIRAHAPATSPRPRTAAEVPTSSPESVSLTKSLRSAGFGFVGPTSMYALLEAAGLVNTHLLSCHRRNTVRDRSAANR